MKNGNQCATEVLYYCYFWVHPHNFMVSLFWHESFHWCATIINVEINDSYSLVIRAIAQKRAIQKFQSDSLEPCHCCVS